VALCDAQNVNYLSKVAHNSYLDGLKKTGIEIDNIPSMYGMNRILTDIGWAVAVDGFIPPNALWSFRPITYWLSLDIVSWNILNTHPLRILFMKVLAMRLLCEP
jgi:hypothetical protein